MKLIYVASNITTRKAFYVTTKNVKVETVQWRVACAAIGRPVAGV